MEQFSVLVLVKVLLNTLLHWFSLLLGVEAEVANFRYFITEEISDDISWVFPAWFTLASWPELTKSKTKGKSSFLLLQMISLLFPWRLKSKTAGLSPQWWLCHHVLWKVWPAPNMSEGGEQSTLILFSQSLDWGGAGQTAVRCKDPCFVYSST